MNTLKLLLAGLVILLTSALLPGLGLSARTESGPSENAKIAVVDLFRILKEARPFVESQAAIRLWIEKEQRTNLGLKKSEIEAVEAELEMFEGDSEQRRAMILNRNLAKLRFDHEFEHLEQQRGQRITASQKQAFAEIKRAVAEVAKARGIGLVLQFREGPLVGLNRGELTSEMYLRNVLYSDAPLDITESVITILHARR